MNRFGKLFKPPVWFAALLLAVFVAGCGDGGGGSGGIFHKTTSAGTGAGVGGAGRGPAPVNLGAAGNFVILAQAGITNVPTSAITGNVGLSPAAGSNITGLTCVEVTGTIYDVNNTGPAPCTTMDVARLTAAIDAKGLAYTDANSRAPDYTELGTGNLGGLNLGPATYKWSTGVLIPTNLTLTGGPNDVWIFQIAGTLTQASATRVTLTGGAQAKNVFWQVADVVAIGTTAHFEGIVLAKTMIAVNTGASVTGRLLAQTAVTLQMNAVTQPAK